MKNGPKILAAAAGSFLFKYVKRVALSLNLPTAAAAAVELFSLLNKIDSHKSIKRNTVLKSKREKMEGGGIITMIVAAVRAHLSSCSYGNKTKTPKK